MTNVGSPIRQRTARLSGVKISQGQGILVLYPDRLAHVRSPVISWASRIGLASVAIPSFVIPPHVGPGVLGVLVGSGGGSLIGVAIAKNQAAKKVAAGSADVTVIPLDSIASIETRRSSGIGGWFRGPRLLVKTAEGAEYGLRVRPEPLSADLARALMARGREVRGTSEGMAVTGLAVADGPPPSPAFGVPADPPPAPPAGLQPWSGVTDPAGFAAGTAAAAYQGMPPLPPTPPRRNGLIIGIVAGVIALTAAGIGAVVALPGSGAGVSLPARLLGLPKYTGPGIQADDARIASQFSANSYGTLVHPAAALYGNPSGAGRGLAVVEGMCAACTPQAARKIIKWILAVSRAGARTFPPGSGGGALVCYPYSASGKTASICRWFGSKTKTALVVAYSGGVASGLADAAAKTRQIALAITR